MKHIYTSHFTDGFRVRWKNRFRRVQSEQVQHTTSINSFTVGSTKTRVTKTTRPCSMNIQITMILVLDTDFWDLWFERYVYKYM